MQKPHPSSWTRATKDTLIPSAVREGEEWGFALIGALHRDNHSPATAVLNPLIGSGPFFNLPIQSRDIDPPEFTLSFSVMVAPPTYVTCQVDGTSVDVAVLSREVIAGEFHPPSTASPVTNVNVTVRTRQAGNYQCTVNVYRASGSNLTDATSNSVPVTG